MRLKDYLPSAVMPSLFLPTLGTIGAGIFMIIVQTNSAQAAGQYYNCANATGCNLVSNKYWTSNHTDTKYPVVMAHGLAGFTKAFGLVDYF